MKFLKTLVLVILIILSGCDINSLIGDPQDKEPPKDTLTVISRLNYDYLESSITKIKVSDSKAVLTTSNSQSLEGNNIGNIISLSTPSTPKKIAKYTMGDTAVGGTIVGDIAYLVDYKNLSIVDFSNPEEPKLLGTYPRPFYDFSDVQVSNSVAYLSSNGSGLEIVDITDPTTPVKISNYNTSSNVVKKTVISGERAYLLVYNSSVSATWKIGVEIVNIADPLNPSSVAEYHYSDTSEFWYFDIVVRGDIFFLSTNSGIDIVDISTEASPVLLKNISSGKQIEVRGKYLYSSDSSELSIYDISAKNKPLLVNSYDLSSLGLSGISDMEASESFLYLAGIDSKTEKPVVVTVALK